MKKLCFIVAFFLFSCSNRENKKLLIVGKELTKLEKQMLLPKESVTLHYDLSDDSLIVVPNLSDRTILSLDLSHNQICTIVTKNLPKKLEKLNLTHNNLIGNIEISEHSITDKKIDLSYNNLTDVNIREPLSRVLLSHNDISELGLYQINVRYLDISYNPNFSNRTTSFFSKKIDTIVRKGIVNNRRMYHYPFAGIRFFSNSEAAEEAMKERDEGFVKIYSDSVEYRKVVRRPRRN